jgi:beta-mannosidase
MPTLTYIDKHWQFTHVGGGPVNKADEWLPASTFPTTSFAELVKLGKIPDPFVGLNELEVQCKALLVFCLT